MTSITLNVTGARIEAAVNGPLTSGMVGIPVTIQYDEAWNGLTKNFVCRCGKWGSDSGETRTILSRDETATVAHEVMQANKRLYLGIEGYSADGKLVMPTTWADCGWIQYGANAGVDPSTDPELAVWAQLQAEIEQIKQNPITEADIAAAVAAYMEENPIDGSDSSQNGNCLPEYSEADNGKVLGIVDGSPAWVEATVNGGGESGGDTGATAHGIVWDLVNVTSSNPVASVPDGASLVSVLTPAEGYRLGDVTITMGGEVVTGVWNADTATVTIVSVTGNVVISCAGVERAEYEEIPVALTWNNGSVSSETGVFNVNASQPTYGSHGELIDGTQHDIRFRFPYDSTYCTADTENGGAAGKFYMYSSADESSYLGRYNPATGEISKTEYTSAWENLYWDTDIVVPCGYFVRVYMRKGAPPDGGGFQSNSLFGSYIKNNMVQVHQVTPTVETMSVAEMVDNDYTMNYGIATTALITDVEDATTFEGVLETAKNEWMTAYGGDMNKIPVIVHTDQHSHLNRNEAIGDVFDTISGMVNWYDISKVINLGDTINSFPNPDNLTEGSPSLENYLDATSEVPWSKRIEIFGNHDTMWMDGAMLTAIYHDQSYLQPYFRNIFARKTSNNGYFVVKDDNFNVKYVAISGFEFDETWANKYIISSEQIDWLIAELSKVDGYDVVLLSHVPIDGDAWGKADISAIVSARRSKTSGTITDGYGVAHDFNFSNCDGELLCSLHGHKHDDLNGYNGDALYNVFSNFYASPRCVYFALIDRANRQLNVWKVDSTPQYQNFQIPLDKPETTE